MDTTSPLRGTISTGTLQGHRDEQEDALCAIPITGGDGEREGWLLAILDGHRGHTISTLGARRIEMLSRGIDGTRMRDKNEARAALRRITRTLIDEYSGYEEGSTLSLTYISETGRMATSAYLGDTPIVIRDATGKISISEPHNARTNTRDREHAIDRGGYYEDGMITLGDRALAPTRAIGDADFDRTLIRTPGIYSTPLGEGSIVLIASDGIITCGARAQKKFFRGMMHELALDPSLLAHHLTMRALKQGSRDNITAILWRT